MGDHIIQVGRFDVNATMRFAELDVFAHVVSTASARSITGTTAPESAPSPQPIAPATRIQHGDDLMAATCIAFSLGVVFEREETGYMRLAVSSS